MSGSHARMRLLAHPPDLEIDVGGRRGRHHVGARSAADAGGVSDKRHARRRVEIRDVMRRVPRRVLDLHLASDDGEGFAPFDDVEVLRRDRLHLAPEPIHVLRVEPAGARQELGRVRQVRRAATVNEHLDVRMLLEDGADRPGVVEVNVRDQNLPDVAEADALFLQRRGQVREGRRRPRIDERHTGGSVEDRGGDDLGTAEEVEVDVIEP